MMHTRRVLGVAAATATVVGLVLPMQAAFAEAGPCPGSDNPTTKVHSLSGDCVLNSTWVVEDGWTIDGNGKTITADATGTFTGPGVLIESTAGTNGAAPKLMNVKHVTIQALHFSSSVVGVLYDGARGTISDVRISGTVGSSGYGVEADNSVGAAFGPTDQVKIDNQTTISGYQRAAIYAHGVLKLGVLRAVIGKASAVSGQPVAGVRFTEGAHGSVKESTISLSDTNPATPVNFGAGVDIVKDNSGALRRVEVKRNVFSGTNADVGVSVSNPGTAKLTAAVDCNLFRRADSRTDDNYGIGVVRWQDSPLTNAQVSNSTFVGNWNHSTGTFSGTTLTPGDPPNNLRTIDSTCVPPAATHVSALGGDGRSKVTWSHGSPALPYAPITSYLVKAKTSGRPAVSKTVGAKATSAVLKGLSNRHTYLVTVTAQSNGGVASATDRLYSTKMSLTAKPGTIHRGAKSSLRGKLSTADPSAGKRKVAIWAKPKGGRWTRIDTVRTTSAGAFSETVRPHKRTTYKAVYGGRPDLASSARTTVFVH